MPISGSALPEPDCHLPFLVDLPRGELPFARGVDRLAENSRSLLRRIKARRVLRFEEVEIELRRVLKYRAPSSCLSSAPDAFAFFESSISATSASVASCDRCRTCHQDSRARAPWQH